MKIGTGKNVDSGHSLTIRRLIRARPEFLFDAWTKPEMLTQWWGPAHVTCPQAEIDLRVGGTYCIANRFDDGNILWISGIFEEIERPRKLVYSWSVDPEMPGRERVCVLFEPRDEATEVTITHIRIPNRETAISHEAGWKGCLDGLADLAEKYAKYPRQVDPVARH